MLYMNGTLTQRELNEILNLLTDGILVTDTKGIILFCNSAAASSYGVSKTKLTGKPITFLLENGIIDQSFWKLAVSAKKPVTYEQICSSRKQLINKTIPVLNQNHQICYIIEQTYCVQELVFDSNAQEILDSSILNQSARPQQADSGAPMAEFTSSAMAHVYNLADNMASKNINILILGASGTGKSRLARRIHDNSTRKNGAFVTINCSTIPENLLESELFGYMKGAFSGASSRGKQGLVELADGGTLFLDEIGEMSLNMQVKLLQLIQEKTYLPIGGMHPKQVDARIIAATNKDLFQQVKNGVFREDLFYRLAVVTITMPALKDRPDDIIKLVHHFTHVFNHKHNMDISFSPSTIDRLTQYSWPGNIRELEHLIEFLILNAKGEYITPYMLPANILSESHSKLHSGIKALPHEADSVFQNSGNAAASPQDTGSLSQFESLDQFLEYWESAFVKEMYAACGTSYKLAERLHISQSKASRLIRKYVK